MEFNFAGDMVIALYVLLFVLGAILASFGGVIIERGKEENSDRKGVFGGRSHCASCKKTLVRRQLIPVLGRMLQDGKCKNCKAPIPSRYVWTEILMGVVFITTGWLVIGNNVGLLAQVATSGQLLFWLLVNRGLVMLILADLLRYELNFYLRIVLVVVVGSAQFVGVIGSWQMMLMGGIVLAAVFGLIYALSARWQTRKYGSFTEGLGVGDVYMAGLVGMFAGIIFGADLGWVMRIQIVLVYLTMSSSLGILFWLGRRALYGFVDASLPFLPAMIVTLRVLILFHTAIFQRLVI